MGSQVDAGRESGCGAATAERPNLSVFQAIRVFFDVGVPAAGQAGGSATLDRQTGPVTGTEAMLAEVLAGVAGVEHVALDGHFFDDLGADSMVMARFCARVRKRDDLPRVSMKDIYRYPTIRSLATALDPAPVDPAPVDPPELSSPELSSADLGSARLGPSGLGPSGLGPSGLGSTGLDPAGPAPARQPIRPPVELTPPGSSVRYLLCGTAQLLLGLATAYLTASVLVWGYEWVRQAIGLVDIYLRSLVFTGAGFLGACLAPILVKWLLVGRWQPKRFRVWGLAYLRFWFVKAVIRVNPLVLFAGTPLYNLYLRALGAKIGRRVVIFSPNVPACTDLLTVGEGTVIRKDTTLSCYRAQAGMIETGPVTLGSNVLVREQSVIDIETAMGDGAQLGHASALVLGQGVPAAERWHGSPARPTSVDFGGVEPARCGAPRRFLYPLSGLLVVLGIYLPLGLSGVVLLLAKVPQLAVLLEPGPLALSGWPLYRNILLTATVLYFGAILVGLVLVATVPRLLNLAIKPGKVYRLYGFHFLVHRIIARRTNSRPLLNVFGDSSYVTHYLRWLGYDLGRVEQTGTNFGTRVKHDNPFLCSVGSGTVVADGLSMINAEYSSTSFRVSPVAVGARSFLGNDIAYPAGGRTGENCLLATKVMVPLDGEVREDGGLLGSPSFEIPRTVQRDHRFDMDSEQRRRRLRAKNRHNTVTIVAHLLARWLRIVGIMVLAGAAARLYHLTGALALTLFGIGSMLVSVGYWILVERTVSRLQARRPEGCSVYDRAFWRHERYWKVPAQTYMQAFSGTPFKNVIWRLLGVRIGRRVFDDGLSVSERGLVTIGDDCTLNAGSGIQSHSQEDGAFKSEHSSVGAGVTLGVRAFVHYGVTVGDGALLAADTFVMKGTDVPPRTRWSGNPATEESDATSTAAKGGQPMPLTSVGAAPDRLDEYTHRPAGPARRGRAAAVALLAAACLAILTAGALVGSGAVRGPIPALAGITGPGPAAPRPAPPPPPRGPPNPGVDTTSPGEDTTAPQVGDAP